MKQSLRLVAATLIVGAVLAGGTAFAGQKHEGRFGADAVLVYKSTSTATVAKIDGENLTVTNEAGKEMVLQVSGKTKIKNASGEKIAASKLEAGQRLEIVHRGEQVLKITVLS